MSSEIWVLLSLRDGILSITLQSPQERERLWWWGRGRGHLKHDCWFEPSGVRQVLQHNINQTPPRKARLDWIKVLQAAPHSRRVYNPARFPELTRQVTRLGRKHTVWSEDLFYLPKLMKIKEWLESSSSHLELLVDHSVLLGEPVDAIIGFSHPPDGSTDGVGLEGSSHTTWAELSVWMIGLRPSLSFITCGLINLGHVDLDAGVILGRQDTVAGRAFPGKREEC